MAHTMIVGQTESGKTILSKKLCCDAIRQGYSVLVLDPVKDPEWFEITQSSPGKPTERGYVTDDPYEYDQLIRTSRNCFLFIDESGDNAGHQDKEFFWWATRSRHWGHSAVFIAQRAQMIAPTVRGQCRYLFMFNSSMTDADILAKEYNHPELKEGSLEQFHYYQTSRFKPVVEGKVEIVNDWNNYLTNGTNCANGVFK